MKKLLLILSAVLIIYGCQREQIEDESVNKWNGYENFYKSGEVTYDLIAGQHIDVGYVTYGIDNNANFYVTYHTEDNWVLLETHVFAGDKKLMPLNKPGNPKIGRFPYSADHGSGVTEYTYYIPLSTLPPCASPGFVVATHAAVKNISNGQNETAWGDWTDPVYGCEFPDRRWGGYNVYYYNVPPNKETFLYGSAYDGNLLNIYLINATDGNSELILSEDVGVYPTGSYDGMAWDPVSNNLFFTTYSEGENSQLMINTMDEDAVSFPAGTLDGVAQSATFYDGQFYYVDETTNSIIAVSFNSDWMISSETVVSIIPDAIVVKDIAISPDGSTMYMVGTYNDETQLVSLDISEDTYVVMTIPGLAADAQIAYGADDVLYAVSTIGTGSLVSSLDPTTGTIVEIGDEEIGGGGVIISDIGKGPVQ